MPVILRHAATGAAHHKVPETKPTPAVTAAAHGPSQLRLMRVKQCSLMIQALHVHMLADVAFTERTGDATVGTAALQP